MRDLELLLPVQGDAGGLLAVAQRRIEDAYVICCVVHAFPFGSLPRFSSSSACGSAAATRYSPRGGRRRSRGSRWNVINTAQPSRMGAACQHPWMRTTSLGSTGPAVSILGLGCMGMSGMYGAADRGESVATIHAAL